jgi:hypothetical protein
MLDSSGLSITGVTAARRQSNLGATPGFLFYLVAEDEHGHRVLARIELVRQVVQ